MSTRTAARSRSCSAAAAGIGGGRWRRPSRARRSTATGPSRDRVPGGAAAGAGRAGRGRRCGPETPGSAGRRSRPRWSDAVRLHRVSHNATPTRKYGVARQTPAARNASATASSTAVASRGIGWIASCRRPRSSGSRRCRRPRQGERKYPNVGWAARADQRKYAERERNVRGHRHARGVPGRGARGDGREEDGRQRHAADRGGDRHERRAAVAQVAEAQLKPASGALRRSRRSAASPGGRAGSRGRWSRRRARFGKRPRRRRSLRSAPAGTRPPRT
jgi:hypothetical protein